MHKPADITFKNNTISISGDLDFWNVMSVYTKCLPYLEQYSNVGFDFSALASSDSAGLALIIEWIKYAKQKNKPLRVSFNHLSKDVLSIAKAAGIDALLRVE